MAEHNIIDIDTPHAEFVGGEMDGKVLALTHYIQEIRFPHQSKLSFSDYYSPFADKGPEITRYRRLGYTHLYICIDWWK